MEDSAARAVRSKRDSSVRVASRLVRDGIAQGFVSAGNTGAVMATAKMVQGVIPGVDRPALAGIFPTRRRQARGGGGCGRQRGLLPAHAGAVRRDGRDLFPRDPAPDATRAWACSPSAKKSTRATTLTRAATPLLKSLALNFIGNVEGRDIYTGNVDVIVCDGFIGNVALKVSEGLGATWSSSCCASRCESTISGKIGYVALPDRVQRFQEARWTIPNTAARRCWACAACASSATAAPTPTPSRTPSGWRPSSPAARVNQRIEERTGRSANRRRSAVKRYPASSRLV